MNAKFSFTFLAILVVVIVTACAPAITDGVAPVAIAVPPAEDQISALIPATGGSDAKTAREAQEPRLWSGEVFLSDSDTPDLHSSAGQDAENACMSEDDLPRRHGGCVE